VEEGASPENYVPEGWTVEKRVTGPLDADSRSDLALVLITAPPSGSKKDDAATRFRALVLLLRKPNGWQRKGLSTTLLQCTTCGGVFGGTNASADVKIEKRELVVEQEFGSREVTLTTHRFRWDAVAGRFSLRQWTASSRDRLEGGTLLTEVTWTGGKRNEKTFAGTVDSASVRLVGTKSSAEPAPWFEDADTATQD